ncbi:hypothetical protein [Aquimarina litoralis]|uniref:hypothetical protein n=1 Tax=Aquimarina litoralis TaxID=584605 RepID=UPI001C58207E|nr:hypothetical protein [Aquimarina litoralis]MBW1298750.1 hypothetical protein [Aquimarina litoralis]
MKPLLIVSIVLCSFQFALAQDQSNLPKRDINKNELSLNPLNIIAFGALDVGYERVLNNNSTIGFDLFYRLADRDDDDSFDSDDIFEKEIAFTTKFKYFFGDRVARGFYVEGFGMLSSGEDEKFIDVFDTQGNFIRVDEIEEDFTDFALGFGVGGKFVARNGFLIDIGFGIGRNLFNNDAPEIIIRPNLYIGYRF